MKNKEIKKILAIVLLLGVLVSEIIWTKPLTGNSHKDLEAAAAATTSVTTVSPSASGPDSTEAVSPQASPTVSPTSSKAVQAVWIAFCDYKSMGLYNKSESQFTANADKMFKKLKEDKINTAYFHTNPCNDAVYPSSSLKWSSYMFTSAPNYDPLKIIIAKAHKYGISLHAWINPYRKTMKTIFNPGATSSTNRIVHIVKEILKKYDVDGIHFDDYFYPSKTPGNQFYKVSISKRKQTINKMVRTVYQTVKKSAPSKEFGISPAGNIENAKALGCDLNTWLSKSGYVDYIIPQIYWSDNYILSGKKVKMYTTVLNRWIALNKNKTPMYIGLGLYRAGWRNSVDKGWYQKNNNIITQIKQEKAKGCAGFVFFSIDSMYMDLAKKEMKQYRAYIK